MPQPANIDQWPPTVRSSELARGTLVRCGPGVRLAAWPDTAVARAHALQQVIGNQLMPILMAAAWVWGCAREPGMPITCSTRGGARPKLPDRPLMRVHEFRYPEADLAACGGLVLPSPVRTACDLVRLVDQVTIELAVTARLLVLTAALTRAGWEEALTHGPGRHRARAMRRLASLSP